MSYDSVFLFKCSLQLKWGKETSVNQRLLLKRCLHGDTQTGTNYFQLLLRSYFMNVTNAAIVYVCKSCAETELKK